MVLRPSQGASPALRGCWGRRAGGRTGQTFWVLSPLGRLEVDTSPPAPLGWDLPPRWPRPFSYGPGAPRAGALRPLLCHRPSCPLCAHRQTVPPSSSPGPAPPPPGQQQSLLCSAPAPPAASESIPGATLQRDREGKGGPRAPTQQGDPGLANGPGGTGPFGRSGGTGSTGRARRGRARAWGRRERSPP